MTSLCVIGDGRVNGTGSATTGGVTVDGRVLHAGAVAEDSERGSR